MSDKSWNWLYVMSETSCINNKKNNIVRDKVILQVSSQYVCSNVYLKCNNRYSSFCNPSITKDLSCITFDFDLSGKWQWGVPRYRHRIHALIFQRSYCSRDLHTPPPIRVVTWCVRSTIHWYNGCLPGFMKSHENAPNMFLIDLNMETWFIQIDGTF